MRRLKMKKYFIKYEAKFFIRVEAKDEESAIDLADEMLNFNRDYALGSKKRIEIKELGNEK